MILQRLIILFSFVTLIGCTSIPAPTTIILENNEKDIYINKIEKEVSESVSALVAVVQTLPEGIPKGLVENQIERLSAISKPSVETTERFKKILSSDNIFAVKQDRKEAIEVNHDTEKLRSVIIQKDSELNKTKISLQVAEANNQREIKDKILWMISCVGAGVAVLGLLIVSFAPVTWKFRGFILSIGGGLAVSSCWILDTSWFQWVIGSAVVIVICDIVYTVFTSLKPTSSHAESVEGLTLHKPIDSSQEVSESKHD